MTLPLKTRILQYAIQHGREFTVNDLLNELQPEYGGEALFSTDQLEAYCDSYLAVGFFAPKKIQIDESGHLQVSCAVTDYGKSRGQYIR